MTRYGKLVDLPEGYASDQVLAALVEAFDQIPEHLRASLTLDQGSEWAQWQTLSDTFDLKTYFCDPHSPWQRGAVENFNGHIRFWLPRGRRLDAVPPDPELPCRDSALDRLVGVVDRFAGIRQEPRSHSTSRLLDRSSRKVRRPLERVVDPQVLVI